MKSKQIDEILLAGFYPRIHDHGLDPNQALSFYVETYLDRDVRSLINVKDLTLFQKFLKNGLVLMFQLFVLILKKKSLNSIKKSGFHLI